MLWFKSCPKCRGDLTQKLDIYGPYVACYQCGHYLTAAEEVLLPTAVRPQIVAKVVKEAAETLVVAA